MQLMSEVLQNTQHIFDLVELCVQNGVHHAVVCPGSRCAPLLISFGLHHAIKTISVTDERSAGFIALGIAQQTSKPVALICTSGTAGQNFAPAVTEAFYQNVPLLVLTADRPPEWIDQWDGQTIHQRGMYGDHVNASVDFTAGEKSLQMAMDVITLAISTSCPVHLNIPVSKPFYPLEKDDLPQQEDIYRRCQRVHANQSLNKKIHTVLPKSLLKTINTSHKILVLSGQASVDRELNHLLKQINIPVIGDIISNIPKPERTDIFFNTDDASFCPDLLITIGRSVISEKHKDYFRNNKPKHHWHIGVGMVGDPYQTLTQIIAMQAVDFFKQWLNEAWKIKSQQAYQQVILERHQQAKKHIQTCLAEHGFNQYFATVMILKALPENSVLHLANSMTVRIANHIGLENTDIEVCSNRGTSGIDGCVSTAVGYAIANPDKIQTLIIGDLAFLYDRNALWLNQELPKSLRIIVMNNKGGGIFKLIPGPTNQGELETLFSTPHQRTAQLTAKEFNIRYDSANTAEELQQALQSLPTQDPSILEVFTDMQANERVFRAINNLDLNL